MDYEMQNDIYNLRSKTDRHEGRLSEQSSRINILENELSQLRANDFENRDRQQHYDCLMEDYGHRLTLLNNALTWNGSGKQALELQKQMQESIDKYEAELEAEVEVLRQKRNTYLRSLIKNVQFNKPYTIVFWNDGTKTVVKCCKKDKFSKRKGLMTAICKKYFDDSYLAEEIIQGWVTGAIPAKRAEQARKEKEARIKANGGK